MDVREMRCMLVIAQEMNLTRAAERLEMAQPHLTRLLHRLEEELGFHLFDRSNKRQLVLTPAGEAFLTRITPLLGQYEQAVQVAQRISRGEVGKLMVGYTAAAVFTVLSAILQAYRCRGEGEIVVRDVSTMTRAAIHRALCDYRLDGALVFGADEEPAIAYERICQAPLRVVLTADHPLAQMEAIPLAALANEPWVLVSRHLFPRYYHDVMTLCQQAGFSPRIEHVAPQALECVSLVTAHAGISLLTQWSEQALPQQAVVYRPLADVAYQAGLYVEWRKDDNSPLVQAFLQVVREVREKL